MKQVALPYVVQSGQLVTHNLNWPQRCACCHHADASTRYTLEHKAEYRGVAHDQVSYYPLTWAVPYCKDCLNHASRPNLLMVGVFVVGGLLWAALGYGLFLLGQAEEALGMIIFLASLVVIAFVGYRVYKLLLDRFAATGPDCCRREYAVTAVSSADAKTITLTFYNDAYALDFAALNGAAPVPAAGPEPDPAAPVS